jgi:hypothetical protein
MKENTGLEQVRRSAMVIEMKRNTQSCLALVINTNILLYPTIFSPVRSHIYNHSILTPNSEAIRPEVTSLA